MGNMEVAYIIVICVLALVVGWRYQRDRMAAKSDFASKEAIEIHGKAKKLFDDGKSSFKDFKNAVDPIKDADAVMYRGCHKAHTKGGFTPDVVQNLM